MLRLKNLSKYYHENGNVVKALDSIDLSFSSDEFVVITGESGSGKSTLLNVLSGLDTYEDGEMYLKDRETSYYTRRDWENYRKENIGFIFQHYNLIDAYTVYQNIEVATVIKGEEKNTAHERVMRLIEQVGLKGKEKQKTSTLSGGEKQRVAIARALAKDAPMIIADEPTGNLDKKTGEKILDLLKSVSKGKLVLLVSHSYESVKSYATRHIRLADGEVILDKELSTRDKDETPVEAVKGTSSLHPFSLLKIALRNIFSTPKRTLFTFTVSLFVVALFALIYGSYVQQTSAVGGFSFSNFRNITEHRVIITKDDHSPFSETDIEHYRAIRDVRAVAPYDIMMDMRVFLIEDNQSRNFTRQFPVQHASVLTPRLIRRGSMPTALNQVVVTDEDYRVGDTIQISFDNTRFIGEWVATTHEFEISGIASADAQRFNQPIYFHDDFFQDPFFQAYGFLRTHDQYTLDDGTNQSSLHYSMIGFDEDIPEGAIRLSSDFMMGFNSVEEGDSLTIGFQEGFTDERITKTLTLDSITEPGNDRSMVALWMNEATLISLFETIEPYQMTLLVEDAFAAEQLLARLEDEPINTLYPAGQSDPISNMLNIMGRLMLGFLSIFILVIMYFVTYLALKNIMQSKRKEYVILRSIGLYKEDLNRINIIEMAVMMFTALIIVIGLLLVNANYYPLLPDYLRYYGPSNYVFVFIALMAMSVLLALRFNRSIFSKSVITAFKDQG